MVAAVVPSQQPDLRIVRYEPKGASRSLFSYHGPEAMIDGPAGTGKTLGSCWRIHLAAMKHPGMRALMVRKVQEDLTASAVVTYNERVLGTGNFGVRAFGGSRFEPPSFQYQNGSRVFVGGLDKANKVMSREYDIVYVNEATEVAEDDWENLTTRTRWGVMPYQQVWGDCNPQGPGHWIHKRSSRGQLRMFNSVHQDNPALWNERLQQWTPAGQLYIDKLSALTGFRRDRLLLGKWTAAEGAVYPMFDRRTHVREMTDLALEGWATVLWLDVGTRNPTALLTARFAGDRIHIQRELYQRGMSSDAITDAVVKEYRGSRATYVVVDPSSAGLIASLQDHGLTVRKGTNDVQEGIRRVTSVLESVRDGVPDLTIDPSCENWIDEAETYRYPDGGRSNSDNPIKEFDHALDATRYGIWELSDPDGEFTALPTTTTDALSGWFDE